MPRTQDEEFERLFEIPQTHRLVAVRRGRVAGSFKAPTGTAQGIHPRGAPAGSL